MIEYKQIDVIPDTNAGIVGMEMEMMNLGFQIIIGIL